MHSLWVAYAAFRKKDVHWRRDPPVQVKAPPSPSGGQNWRSGASKLWALDRVAASVPAGVFYFATRKDMRRHTTRPLVVHC